MAKSGKGKPYIDFGTAKHIFIDWIDVESGYGCELLKYKPYCMPYGVNIIACKPRVLAEPALEADNPWEKAGVSLGKIIEEEGLLRMWYTAYPCKSGSETDFVTCYAESRDGIVWRKPHLGIIEFQGSMKNNIVYNTRQDNGLGWPGLTAVFKDSSAVQGERYKALVGGSYVDVDNPGSEREVSRMYGAVSPDGFHWKPFGHNLLIPQQTEEKNRFTADGNIWAEFSAIKNVYRGYLRYVHYTLPCRKRRLIGYAETQDFRHWPAPRFLMGGEPEVPPDWDINTFVYSRWPGVKEAHLMLLGIYQHTPDLNNVHLAVSRDGIHWNKLSQEPIIPNSSFGKDPEICLTISPSSQIFRSGKGEWSFIVNRCHVSHNLSVLDVNSRKTRYPASYRSSRAVVREDGFTALEAESQGEFWTLPGYFNADVLLINAVTPVGGEIRVELIDHKARKVIEGFSLDDCEPLSGDVLWQAVKWKGKSAINQFSEKIVRLHFRLVRARLHAYRFQNNHPS